MSIQEFYLLCNELGMLEDGTEVPSTIPELIAFLRDLITYNGTEVIKDLLFCMIERE